MMTNLINIVQSLTGFSLVLAVQIMLLLLLRKPVRRWLGAVACYRMWALLLLWVPVYVFGQATLLWLRQFQPSGTQVTGAATNALPATARDDFLQFEIQWPALGGATVTPQTSALFWSVLAVLWLAGTCGLIVWQSYRLFRFSRYVRQAAESLSPRELIESGASEQFGELVAACSLGGMSSAAVFGIGRPVLLLPEKFCQHFDKDQRHIILAHEAVHLRRHDNLWNLCASLLFAIFWTNPLMFLAWRYYQLDQELSCDALALTNCSTEQQKRYARTLLDSLGSLNGSGLQPGLCAWDNLRHLKERSVMITQHLKLTDRPLATSFGFIAVAIIGISLTIGFSGLVSPTAFAAEANKPEKVEAKYDETISPELKSRLDKANQLRFANKREEALAELNVLKQLSEQGKLNNYESFIVYQSIGSAALFISPKSVGDDSARLQGIAALEESLKFKNIRPERSAFSLNTLALLYARANQGDKALEYALKAIDVKGSIDPSTVGFMALLFMSQQQNAQAVTFLEKMIELDHGNPDRSTTLLLQDAYNANKQWDKALKLGKELFPNPNDQERLEKMYAYRSERL